MVRAGVSAFPPSPGILGPDIGRIMLDDSFLHVLRYAGIDGLVSATYDIEVIHRLFNSFNTRSIPKKSNTQMSLLAVFVGHYVGSHLYVNIMISSYLA